MGPTKMCWVSKETDLIKRRMWWCLVKLLLDKGKGTYPLLADEGLLISTKEKKSLHIDDCTPRKKEKEKRKCHVLQSQLGCIQVHGIDLLPNLDPGLNLMSWVQIRLVPTRSRVTVTCIVKNSRELHFCCLTWEFIFYFFGGGEPANIPVII